jgi:tetratricopeptide (TPR) repeat protein
MEGKNQRVKIFRVWLLCVFSLWSLIALPISATATKTDTVAKKKINPQAFKLCDLAVKVASQGQYDAAVVYLQRALTIEPKFPEALFNLGSIYRVQRKYQDSYFAFQKLLAINPKDNEARLEKVLTLIALKSYKEANVELAKVPSTEKRYETVKAQLEKATQKSPYKEEPAIEPKPSPTIITTTKPTPKIAQNDISTPKPKPVLASLNTPSNFYHSESSPYKDSPSKTNPQKTNKKESLSFTTPTGITADSDNNVYIANFSSDTIDKISSDGSQRSLFASGNLLSGPSGLIFDKESRELLVSNYKTGTIIKIDQAGKMKTLVENLEKPYSLFLKEDGRLYVSEQGKKAVSIINIH